MQKINKNSYHQILEENCKVSINTISTAMSNLGMSSLEEFAINIQSTTDTSLVSLDSSIGQFVRYSGNHGGIVNSYSDLTYSENVYGVRNVNGLPVDWILARERLINNAKILNNGWTVDWNNYQNSDQEGRSYLYASNYNSETNRFLISETYAVFKHHESGFIFKNRDLAQQFIINNEEDLQIYFSL